MDALLEFEKLVDHICGVYLDATTGFSLVKEQLETAIMQELLYKDIEKCEVLHWYKENDKIFIDEEKFEQIIFYIKRLNRYPRLYSRGTFSY